MILDVSNNTIYLDESLVSFKENIVSIFEALKKIPCESFKFFITTEIISNSLLNHINFIKDSILGEVDKDEKFEKLFDHLKTTNVSFSWGYYEYEFIFIIITDKYIIDVPSALIGLIVHEIIHGLERQRGLEDDLRRSLDITIKTFSDIAELIPKYIKSDLITLLRNIGEIAVYTLKDLYVNREAIERGFSNEILDQYKFIFEIESLDGPSLQKFPKLELNLQKIEKNKLVNLNEFEKAFITILGLSTAWLPFTRLSSGYHKQQALEIKQFITETYEKVQVISERFRHLENVYLTEFSFSKKFHQRWFSEVFSIVVDILSCGEFIIWQFSHLVIKLEDLIEKKKIKIKNNGFEDSEFYTINDLILIPILKAAFLFSETNTSMKLINSDIKAKLSNYLDEEDENEWIQFKEDYSLEHLMLFALSELIQLLRKKFLLAIQNLRIYTGIVLDVLQILIDIDNTKFSESYKDIKEKILKFITDRDSRFLSLKILYPLEFEVGVLLKTMAEIEDESPFTANEASEFLQLARFFALPKLNWILDLAKRFAKIIKMNLLHTKEESELDIEVIALTSIMLIKDFDENEINMDLLIPTYRATLMSINIPDIYVKAIVKIFGGLLSTNDGK